jgi:hypothetical protein
VIPNARLCKALLDRISDRVHILETRHGILSDPADGRKTQPAGKSGEKPQT